MKTSKKRLRRRDYYELLDLCTNSGQGLKPHAHLYNLYIKMIIKTTLQITGYCVNVNALYRM